MNIRRKQPNDEEQAKIQQAINAYNGLCSMQELAYQHGIPHLAGRLGRDINQQKKVREAVAAYDGLSSAREVADKHGIPLVLIDQALMERVTHNGRSGGRNKILTKDKEHLLREDVESGKVAKRYLKVWLRKHNAGVTGSKAYRDGLWKKIRPGDKSCTVSSRPSVLTASPQREASTAVLPSASTAQPQMDLKNIRDDRLSEESSTTTNYNTLTR
jgi:hypothetical protein